MCMYVHVGVGHDYTRVHVHFSMYACSRRMCVYAEWEGSTLAKKVLVSKSNHNIDEHRKLQNLKKKT